VSMSMMSALLACLAIAGAAPPDEPTSRPDPSAAMAVEVDLDGIGPTPGRMAGVIGRYDADRGSVSRSAPPALGPAHEGLLRRFDESWLKAVESLDFDAMGLDDRVDSTLLKNRLNSDARRLDLDAKERAEMAPMVPFAATVLGLDASRRRMERPEGREVASALTGLVGEVDAARKRVEAMLDSAGKGGADPARPVALRAARAVGRLRSTLRDAHGFHAGYDPVYSWWAAEPFKAADRALEDYETFLRGRVVGLKPDDKTTIVGDPIGREALIADLESAMIPYSPEELIAIAGRELAWCDGEMARAARDLGFGTDWRAALEKVKTLHVESGGQPDLIRDLAVEAIAFLDANDLVTIPPLARTSWRMEMMSPERQLVNPFFTGGEVLSVSFPTAGMTHEQKLMSMRGNNIHFSRATVHHEVIPGHHLQAFMTDRYRPYRQAFSTPFWVEGWALYWEMTLWDKGFPKTAEDRVGFLFWRMHRCARILFSLKFHLGTMPPAECIDFLVDRVGHERENATAEVRRSFNGGYGPLYQCAYMLGALQFRALRAELVGPGRMGERAFHDAILREGSIPVEMVRAILTKQAPPRDFVTRWRFAGEIPKAD